MKKKPIYGGARHYESFDNYYGSKVTAYFYADDKIAEGEPFGDDEDTGYVDDMGSEWQKGHMLAKSLGGDNKVHNMLPMKTSVNNSTFKTVENYVRKLIEYLPDIQKEVGAGTLHIEYTVERVSENPIRVKGYKFPSKFSYSIKILKEDGTMVNSFALLVVLSLLEIAPEIELSDTLRVDE